MTPGRNCSTTTSALSISGRSLSIAPGAFRSIEIDRLPLFSRAKLTESSPSRGWYSRISSPDPGRSILITSAPASASSNVASGPGSKVVKSSTRMPDNGCILAVFLPIASVDKATADQLTVDLVGALPDLRDLGVAHQSLDTEVPAISIAAIQLHRFGRHPHRQIRGAQFEHRRFDPEIGCICVDETGNVPQPSLAQRQFGGEVGEQELNSLEFDDPPPRLTALIDIGDGILERGAGDAERVRGNARPRLVE